METIKVVEIGNVSYLRIPKGLVERFKEPIPMVRTKHGITFLYDYKYINKNMDTVENEAMEDERFIESIEYLSQFSSHEERMKFEKKVKEEMVE